LPAIAYITSHVTVRSIIDINIKNLTWVIQTWSTNNPKLIVTPYLVFKFYGLASKTAVMVETMVNELQKIGV
jgi:hypothetical protein